MSLLKSINRLKQIHKLIKIERTGNPDEFAKKLGISRAMLMINLQEIKELGAEINFCRYKNSYYYINDFLIIIQNKKDQKKIRGGRCSLMALDLNLIDLSSPKIKSN
ncbi:MAG: DNA-binding protein [Chryseotalea sp.]|jgi:hypothetical protein